MILIGNCNPPLLQTPRQALSSPALVVFVNSGGESLGVANVAESIPSHVLRQIKKEIDDEKDKSS
jgi:hypothetical protein